MGFGVQHLESQRIPLTPQSKEQVIPPNCHVGYEPLGHGKEGSKMYVISIACLTYGLSHWPSSIAEPVVQGDAVLSPYFAQASTTSWSAAPLPTLATTIAGAPDISMAIRLVVAPQEVN